MSQGASKHSGRSQERRQRTRSPANSIRIFDFEALVSLAFPFRHALSLLMQAQQYAQKTGRSVWDFAVEIQDLKDLGLTSNDLRWMICQDWLEHAREVSGPGEDIREYQPEHRLSFSSASCFVLKELGVAAANQVATEAQTVPSPPLATVAGSQSNSAAETVGSRTAANTTAGRPSWDAERNRLYVGGVLVKEFKLPCPNQGTILMAFEEEDWPARIDDPLPPNGDTDAKTRLCSTIKSLNKYQKHRLIQFMGDGTGEGVMWELIVGHGPGG